jgi:hypothetical protein
MAFHDGHLILAHPGGAALMPKGRSTRLYKIVQGGGIEHRRYQRQRREALQRWSIGNLPRAFDAPGQCVQLGRSFQLWRAGGEDRRFATIIVGGIRCSVISTMVLISFKPRAPDISFTPYSPGGGVTPV